MPTTIVCIFPDRSTTQSAVDRLLQAGVPRPGIRLHAHTPTVRNAAILTVDELASGGLIGNMRALLDGLLDHHLADGYAETYADVVRSEGTLVSIELGDEAQARQCIEALHGAGALRISTLPERDTVSFHRLYPLASSP